MSTVTIIPADALAANAARASAGIIVTTAQAARGLVVIQLFIYVQHQQTRCIQV